MTQGRCLADRFWILETIDAGGVTELYLARDAELDERVALRVLGAAHAERWEALRDACREARPLAHPQIARVFDFHRARGAPFICREFIEGASFGDLARASRADRLGALAQVATALEAAHAQGVFHGDLKPSKLLRDERGMIRVVDFRIAAALRVATAQGAGGAHASPQVQSGEPATAADDVYSLGALAAHALAREPLPRELAALLGAMRAESRSARPQDLREIRQTLLAHANDGALPRAGPPLRVGPTTHAESPLRAKPPRTEPPLRAGTHEAPHADEPRAAGAARNRQYAIAGAVLALALFAVFFALPRWVEPRAAQRSPREPGAPGSQQVASAADTDLRDAASAESARNRLLAIRARLEASAVERWAHAEYEAARELERRGDAALGGRDHAAAAARYAEALAAYESLAARRDALLGQSVADGEAALAAREPARAARAFELALAIEPGHAAALDGARRAGELASIEQHMAEGSRLEQQHLVDAARSEYARAAAIDPGFAPAREALARVDAARTARDFDAELALALASLADAKLGPARAHFEAARALRPASAEVIDGLRQLQQIESSRAITAQRELAEAAESAERWSDAASHYAAILQVQPNLAFAEQGLQRSREFARVTERIAQLLADPALLLGAATLEEARRLASSARTAASGSPGLADQLRELELAMQLASTPIAVAFESDAATEVVIRGVGTLGSFERRDYSLRPGRYVVIGRRDGYRDTRTEISVVPGARPAVVDVRCTEKI